MSGMFAARKCQVFRGDCAVTVFASICAFDAIVIVWSEVIDWLNRCNADGCNTSDALTRLPVPQTTKFAGTVIDTS